MLYAEHFKDTVTMRGKTMIRKLAVSAAAVLLLSGIAAAQETKPSAKAAEIKIGSKAPNFTVTGIDGKPIVLADRLKNKKNLVLCFNRALW
ncbi:MAG: hypothetical protein Aurels2KO_51770 [Aureliella sp.]